MKKNLYISPVFLYQNAGEKMRPGRKQQAESKGEGRGKGADRLSGRRRIRYQEKKGRKNGKG